MMTSRAVTVLQFGAEVDSGAGGVTDGGPSSIHGDARGELYITMTNGTIYQIEAGP